ncbi:MAG: hypothetical protein Q9171_003159 [Xanthocarpia ochracea]
MDPASLSFAVVGMFLTCCKGYEFLSNASNAPADAQDAARRVLVEFDILRTWGKLWDLSPHSPEQQCPEKFKFYLTNEYTWHGVFVALSAISETFTDVRRLNNRHGIVCYYPMKGDRVSFDSFPPFNRVDVRHLARHQGRASYQDKGQTYAREVANTVQSPRVPQDVRDFLDGRDDSLRLSRGAASKVDEETKKALGLSKTKMSLLERCRWSIRAKGRIKSLIGELKRCNEDLQRLCHFDALAQMIQTLPAVALLPHKNFMDLHKKADIVKESAQDKSSPIAAGRERLAAMARFKARLLTPSKIADKYQASWRSLEQRDYHVLSSSNPYSMGTSLKSQEPVFVEWQSYRGKDNRPDVHTEELVHELGRFLSVPDRPYEFRGLDCTGLFKDHANDRYGVVYSLPARLRDLPRHMRTETLDIYKPSTLTDLLHNGRAIADLGDRFDLAKKLTYSVVALHTCGWLHKNICPGNILFFAARPAVGESISRTRKDFGRPVIVGYGLSRPDDIAGHPEERDGDAWASRAPALPSKSEALAGQPEERDAGVRARRRGPQPSRQRTQSSESLDRETIYQHPDKTTNYRRRFRHSYDIYSLGLVLLEIGLWKDLGEFGTNFEDAYEFRQMVLKSLVPKLWGQCGAIYGEVVKECLTISTDDVALAEKGQRDLALKLAVRLDKCVA